MDYRSDDKKDVLGWGVGATAGWLNVPCPSCADDLSPKFDEVNCNGWGFWPGVRFKNSLNLKCLL